MIRNVLTPRKKVHAILPVRFPPPGGKGTIPIMLATKIKKKHVSNHGAYLGASSPKQAFITSSYMFIINICIKPVNPFGAGSSNLCFLHQRAGIRIIKSNIIASMKSTQTVLVIDKSKGIISCPLIFSTILFGLSLASLSFITRL